jgi:hypothetical protein
MLAWIGHHWLLSGSGVLVLALIVFAPAVAAAIGRWLIGTEVGRYLLLAAIVIASGKYALDARFSAGRAAGLAECAQERSDANTKTGKQVAHAEDANADGTKAARQSASKREAERQERTTRVETYARNAVDHCAADPDLVRELGEGASRFRAAEDRLRGDGRAAGEAAEPAR